jgi:GNAT superfamily N-acetyltransferase
MEYLIRCYQDGDSDSLIRLCQEHAAYERDHYDLANKKELIERAILGPSPSLHCWVVEVRNQVVGYMTYTFDFSTWHARKYLHMDCLYLEEPYRGYGIGQEILQRLEKVARQNDCFAIQWQTPLFNERAIKFYQRTAAIGNDKKRYVLFL